MSNNDKQAIERIDEAISNLKENNFTFFFFIVDCKNVPNGNMQYMYQLAKTLNDKNYNVKMLYQLENEYNKSEIEELNRKEKPIDERRVFTGVGEWLGEEYMNLPHINISKEEWKVSPSDFLFIPEVFSSLMKQTYQFKAPCKRIVVLHNYDYITEFIPFNDEWGTYGIRDVITNTDQQGKLINSVFPYIKCKTLNPYISDIFRKPIKPKKLIVNIISKRTEDVNKIMKQFYWKYPMYKFISFRDLRGYPKEMFAEFLQESAITVWVDNETPFGYSAIEAIRTGNILIGKVPEHSPEWMSDDDGLLNNAVWTYDINTIPDILSQVLGSWMQDKIPAVLYENMEKLDNLYTYETYEKKVDEIINEYINERIKEFTEIKIAIKSKNNE
jgi:hypothetical protein